jgi:two-component system, OmpR family, response regulator ChvI
MTLIALIDDDINIVTSLKILFESEEFNVITAHDGEAGYDLITVQKPDLVILDIKMPKMDGIDLLQKLRASITLPIIMLTSKDDEIDQITGFQSGADDYITKPFSQRLLLERVKTLLRRAQVNIAPTDTNLLIRGFLTLNDDRHEISWKDKPLSLTITEYLMIKSLTTKVGHVRSRDQLINDSYGESIYVDDRMVDTHIKRIRKKFKEIDETFDHIETLYGVGYRFKEA